MVPELFTVEIYAAVGHFVFVEVRGGPQISLNGIPASFLTPIEGQCWISIYEHRRLVAIET